MKISHQSLKEIVVQRLRQEMFEGAFPAGTHLVEQSLADQYGVSRGPIREALTQLEQEGLVQVLPRRATVVTGITPQEAYEIYSVRGHLEGLAVKLAASTWNPERTARLQALLNEMEQLGTQDWFRAIELDQEFHHTVVEASGNRTLGQVYAQLDSKVVACFLAVKRYLGTLPVEMAGRHRGLVAALARGDVGRAEILAIEHWAQTGDRFLALVEAGTPAIRTEEG